MIELLALEVTIPVAGLVIGSRFARGQLRARADRRWRRHETARYAACLRNIDRLEHELGIGLTDEQREEKRALERAHLYGRHVGAYAMSAATMVVRNPYEFTMRRGTMIPVDEHDDIRVLEHPEHPLAPIIKLDDERAAG